LAALDEEEKQAREELDFLSACSRKQAAIAATKAETARLRANVDDHRDIKPMLSISPSPSSKGAGNQCKEMVRVKKEPCEGFRG
jgi:hypothetical protein